ncbi:hypothetical protein DFJ74DRAFT_738863 [Hyaloraphidium curvatum]|nr:hypothetical protein DFJ74DRAFT_738863 [Hyaloraphidium curvatum]
MAEHQQPMSFSMLTAFDLVIDHLAARKRLGSLLRLGSSCRALLVAVVPKLYRRIDLGSSDTVFRVAKEKVEAMSADALELGKFEATKELRGVGGGYELIEAEVRILGGCKNLETLSIEFFSGKDGLVERAVRAIGALGNLKVLDVAIDSGRDRVCGALHPPASLEYLKIKFEMSYGDDRSDQAAREVAPLLRQIEGLPCLAEVHFASDGLGCFDIGAYPRLASLIRSVESEELEVDFWDPAELIALGVPKSVRALQLLNAHVPHGKEEAKLAREAIKEAENLEEFVAEGGSERGRSFWRKAWESRA